MNHSLFDFALCVCIIFAYALGYYLRTAADYTRGFEEGAAHVSLHYETQHGKTDYVDLLANETYRKNKR